MDLPVMPPVKPMLAKSVATIPAGMHYEAKWDGFRAIVFRDGDELELGSRTTKPLTSRSGCRSGACWTGRS
jgi:ATP-dependent DNA ligase